MGYEYYGNTCFMLLSRNSSFGIFRVRLTSCCNYLTRTNLKAFSHLFFFTFYRPLLNWSVVFLEFISRFPLSPPDKYKEPVDICRRALCFEYPLSLAKSPAHQPQSRVRLIQPVKPFSCLTLTQPFSFLMVLKTTP